jgi:hypothetical protein
MVDITAQYQVATTNSVVITNVKRTENQTTFFVTINTKISQPPLLIFCLKKNDEVAFTQKYTLKQRRENQHNVKGLTLRI